MDVGQATVEAVVVVRETFVIEAEKVKDGGPKIPHRGWVFLGAATKLIRRSVAGASFDTGTHHPESKAIGIVITTGGVVLMGRHAAKFSAPNNKSVIQKAPLLEVGEKGCGRLVKDWEVTFIVGF